MHLAGCAISCWKPGIPAVCHLEQPWLSRGPVLGLSELTGKLHCKGRGDTQPCLQLIVPTGLLREAGVGSRVRRAQRGTPKAEVLGKQT